MKLLNTNLALLILFLSIFAGACKKRDPEPSGPGYMSAHINGKEWKADSLQVSYNQNDNRVLIIGHGRRPDGTRLVSLNLYLAGKGEFAIVNRQGGFYPPANENFAEYGIDGFWTEVPSSSGKVKIDYQSKTKIKGTFYFTYVFPNNPKIDILAGEFFTELK
jgi:hypothetical protein